MRNSQGHSRWGVNESLATRALPLPFYRAMTIELGERAAGFLPLEGNTMWSLALAPAIREFRASRP